MDAVNGHVPEPARLLRDFLNTVEWQTNQESLTSPTELSRWLQVQGLQVAGVTVGTSELELAKTVREGLRSILEAHAGHDVDQSAVDALNQALARVPLVMGFTASGDAHLTPGKAAKNTATLGPLIAAINASQVDGTWERLKVCARDSCRWAFYDSSRNRSGRWCSMAGCGNYVKMRRAYAVRTGRPVL